MVRQTRVLLPGERPNFRKEIEWTRCQSSRRSILRSGDRCRLLSVRPCQI